MTVLLAYAWGVGRPSANGVIALALLAVPVAEVTCAIVRRGRSGRSLMAGDRAHPYDLLVAQRMVAHSSQRHLHRHRGRGAGRDRCGGARPCIRESWPWESTWWRRWPFSVARSPCRWNERYRGDSAVTRVFLSPPDVGERGAADAPGGVRLQLDCARRAGHRRLRARGGRRDRRGPRGCSFQRNGGAAPRSPVGRR